MNVRRARAKVADAVWLIAAGFATVLAMGLVCVVFGLNAGNPIVAFFLRVSGWLDFGTLKLLSGKDAVAHERIIDWGVAAVVWLVIGRVAERLIRP